jgi:hypothetical protein
MSGKTDNLKKKKLKKLVSEYSGILTFILVVIGIILIGLLIFLLKKENRSFINIISIIGTMASIFGLTITYIQIIAIKEISVITQTTIQNTKDKIILGLSISDVTEAIEVIGEIETNIGLQKYEIAWIMLKQLKGKLFQFLASEEFKKNIDEKEFKTTIEFVSIQCTTLYLITFTERDETLYDPEPINKCLQRIYDLLNDFKSRIKYNTV